MSTRSRTAPGPEQLLLLADSDLPMQFRLDQRTRVRGLAHVAEIRRLLDTRSSRPSEGISCATADSSALAHRDAA